MIRQYADETQLPAIMALIGADLSEPYSIYTYRYFINNWPRLCHVVVVFAAAACSDVSRRRWTDMWWAW